MDEARAEGAIRYRYLITGAILWAFLLVLALLQASAEGVHFGTPYGLVVLRDLTPIVMILLFFLLALSLPESRVLRRVEPAMAVQILFLLLILILTYWASLAFLRATHLLLLAIWLTLPLLFLAHIRFISSGILLSLLSIVVTLIGLEGVLRGFPALWPDYSRQVGSNWRRLHADIPDLKYTKDGVLYEINELGFRGTAPAPDHVPIVSLGDSFTLGVGSDAPWPEELARLMDAETLNLGMGGTDPPKHVNALREYGLPRDPDFVVHAYFEGNDFFTCYQPPRPKGARWGDRLVLPDVLGASLQSIEGVFERETITSELTYDSVTPFRRTIADQDLTLTFSPAYSATLTLDRETLTNSENWRILTGSILELQEEALDAGAVYVLVYIPERTHIYWPFIRQDVEILETLDRDMVYRWKTDLRCLVLEYGRGPSSPSDLRERIDGTIDHQRDSLRDFLDEHGIPMLDLTEVFTELAIAGIEMADPLETHYNDAINFVIAEEIAVFLQGIQE